jgi:hypothetical protein
MNLFQSLLFARPSPILFCVMGLSIAASLSGWCLLHAAIEGGSTNLLVSFVWALSVCVPWWLAWGGLYLLSERLSSVALYLSLAAIVLTAYAFNISFEYGVDCRVSGVNGRALPQIAYERAPIIFVVVLYFGLLRAFRSYAFDLLRQIRGLLLSNRDTAERVLSPSLPLDDLSALTNSADCVRTPRAPPVDIPQFAGAVDAQFRIAVQTRAGEIVLAAEDIQWVRAAGNYVELRAHENVFLHRLTLTHLSLLLEPLGFVRIHRSYLVNWASVQAVGGSHGKPLRVVLIEGNSLPVGRSYRTEVERRR